MFKSRLFTLNELHRRSGMCDSGKQQTIFCAVGYVFLYRKLDR